MPKANRAAIDQSLASLFEAERNARRLRAELAEGEPGALLDAVDEAIKAARESAREDERVLRLASLADVLGRMAGPRAVDLLVDVLNSEEPEARHAAGVALEELAFDRFKEVALGVERALVRLPHQSPALTELPYILVDVPEPGVAKLLHLFLEHGDADAVAAGIEACVELGDPRSVRALAKLEKDKRTVEVEDDQDSGAEVTLGELAREARALLESAEKDEP